MPTVGSLAYQIIADTSAFDKGVASTEAGFAKLQAIGGVAMGAMAVSATAAAVAYKSLNVVIDKVSEAMERQDKIAKTAAKLGITGGNLVGIRRAAADIGGVDTHTTEIGLTRFGENIGKAAMTGEGTAATSLERLGLSANELSGMSLDKAFLEVANALEKVESVDERLALSKGIFGKGGSELATTLAAGGTKIQELIDLEKQLSQTDWVNRAEIEAANTSLENVSKVFEGMADIIASDLSPMVRTLADDFVSLTLGVTKSGEGFRTLSHMASLSLAGGLDAIEGLVTWGTTGFGEEADYSNYGRLTKATLGGIMDANSEKAASTKAIAQREDEKAATAAAKFAEMEWRAQLDLANAAEKANKNLEHQKELLIGKDIERQMNAVDELMQKAQSWRDKLQTGTEKDVLGFTELLELRQSGDIDDQLFGRGLQEIADRAEDKVGLSAGANTMGAIRGGSVEALRQQFSGKDVGEKQLRKQEEQLKEQRKANDLLLNVKNEMAKLQIKEAV